MVCHILIILCFIGFFVQRVSAQKLIERRIVKEELKRDEMHIRFLVSTSKIDPNYMNNADSLQRIIEWVNEVKQDSMVDIVRVEFCGAVSPEGSVRFNRYLSNARLTALENYVRSRIEIPEEIIIRNDHYIAWNELEAMVEQSDFDNKDDIIAILHRDNQSVGEQLDSRIDDLKKMDNGKTWRKLYNMFFADMRNAYTVLVTKKSQIAIEYERQMEESIAKMEINYRPTMVAPALTSIPASVYEPVQDPEMRYMYLKSNIAGLGLLMANIGIEFDMGRKLSFNLPIYYSAVNYFCHTLKFRTFSIQPELRFWPKDNSKGLFIGIHAGFAYYNFAFNGAWRYQDKDGKTPTLGGGISLGYRLPISNNERWHMELAAGAGIYPLHYDVFHNERNGQLYDTRKKNYVGLDNILVGISYRIPLKEVQSQK